MLPIPSRTRRSLRMASGVAVVGLALPLTAGCGGDSSSGQEGTTTVVVTYSILGSVVSDIVGDAAQVKVLMPNGIDPHEWEPSAKDIEAVSSADLVVANGLGLEPGLEGALEEAAADGVAVFYAGDQIDVRTVGAGETPDDEEAGTDDPHLWLSPQAMGDVVSALEPLLDELGIEIGDRAEAVTSDLAALDAEVATVLGVVAADDRKLVTGHESLGYFADRYDFTLVGAVVPSLSSQAETSAGELADLTAQIEAEGVTVIFTEVGTSADVVQAVADETGASVVELGTHVLPDAGGYRAFMLGIANTVAAALST